MFEGFVNNPSIVRDWARANGYEVADTGQIPRKIVDAYLRGLG